MNNKKFHNTNKSAVVEKEYIEKILKISRVNKVVKGGKRMSFRAFVIVGDGKGQVGIGLGKSKEVPVAIKKGIDLAKKSFCKINTVGCTVPHDVIGKFGASRVLIKPAKHGTGVIAGGAVRVILEALGLEDVVAKSLGSGNAINNARATLNGLNQMILLENEIKRRGKSLSVSKEILSSVQSKGIINE